MVRLGWSIPQVGHLCGAVVVGVVLPVVGQWCANPAACPLYHPKPPIRCHHTPRQTKCLGTPFPAQHRGILPPNQTPRSHPQSIPLSAGQS